MNKQDLITSSYLGMQFAIIICLFGGAGYWLDGKFGTRVLFTLIFLILGFIAGMYLIIKTAQQKAKK